MKPNRPSLVRELDQQPLPDSKSKVVDGGYSNYPRAKNYLRVPRDWDEIVLHGAQSRELGGCGKGSHLLAGSGTGYEVTLGRRRRVEVGGCQNPSEGDRRLEAIQDRRWNQSFEHCMPTITSNKLFRY